MWSTRSLAFALVLVGSASVARGESGSPGVVTPFDDKDVVPTNALIPLPGANGVPVGLAELRKLAPRLVSGERSVALQIVDSFDDLEGHSTPFPEDGGGYGNNLILLAPRWRLSGNTRYALTIGKGTDATAYFDVMTGTEPDTKAPNWRHAPFLDLDDLHAKDPLIPSHIITAVDEPAELPLYFIVNLEPQDPGARPKRMIAALHLSSPDDDDNCGLVNVWDHSHGVYAEDTDSDLGKRYVARLTAVDAAGNRRSAPPPGVPIVWSGSIAVCNQPDALQATNAKPAPPRWRNKPTLQSTIDSDSSPTSDEGTPYKHTLELPIETTLPAYVELTIRRRSAPFTSYRRVALLSPTIRVSPNPVPPAPDDDNCVEALITNADRKKPVSNDEPVSVRVAIIDALGRRIEHPGPPLVVTKLHPEQSRVLVCPTP